MTDTVFAARPVPLPDRTDSAGSSRGARAAAPEPTVFAAIALTLVALLLWGATQTWLLVVERGALQQAEVGQQRQIEAAGKVRTQLDAIATGMQRLAESGNASARQVVDELRRRGVTINAGPAAAK